MSCRPPFSGKFPTLREGVIMIVALALWLVVTAMCVGFRPEHLYLAALIAVLFFACGMTRRMVVALLPFIVFGISYDWMNIVPNYEVNSVDIEGLYNSEKSLFGITEADGGGVVRTPNEFFALHNAPWVDFLAGISYLCWVPVPILFGLWLYFGRQERVYLHFSLVFLFVNLLGFAIYYIHPAAPPWYVAKYGFDFIAGTPGDVAGLGRFDQMTGWSIFDGLYARNSNVFAAVPSLHSAYTFIAFIYSFKARCPMWLKVLFGVITMGIWFTAVYSGHHYLIDVLLGITTALVGIALFEYGLMRIGAFRRFVDIKYCNYISNK
ncbi:MAG: phosphatase PAP2 family protein [Muribaculaceae bacterium]|nr:phosphatase PAP2 family protein [Muribaculaceae bacterium]